LRMGRASSPHIVLGMHLEKTDGLVSGIDCGEVLRLEAHSCTSGKSGKLCRFHRVLLNGEAVQRGPLPPRKSCWSLALDEGSVALRIPDGRAGAKRNQLP